MIFCITRGALLRGHPGFGALDTGARPGPRLGRKGNCGAGEHQTNPGLTSLQPRLSAEPPLNLYSTLPLPACLLSHLLFLLFNLRNESPKV